MRVPSSPNPGDTDLRRPLERLDGLPMRPASARAVLATLVEVDDPDLSHPAPSTQLPAATEIDPAWALIRSRDGTSPLDPLASLAGHPWWTGQAANEGLTRLWRHAMAVAFAAHRLAREAGDPDPDGVGRAGMLHGLGLWAMAAVDPARLDAWLEIDDPAARRRFERETLGAEASSLGRTLARRWGCEPLVVDAAWLHADRGGSLNGSSAHGERLAFVQQGFALAERTPWALGASPARGLGPGETRLRIVMAEVQARCGAPFVDIDATPREERLTLDNARLRLDNARLGRDRDALDRFARAVADSSPHDGPEGWSERAALAWCGEPGVASARVAWGDRAEVGAVDQVDPSPRPVILPLGDPDAPAAIVHLWRAEGPTTPPATLDAWHAWTRATAERFRLEALLDEVVAAHRGRVAAEDSTLERAKLEALAEFAAGAGHELNNPLAVIVGRGQLLLAREVEPDAQRSLRAIIAQAQRAHRILRDLMYVARPPEPRPRACQPVEIARASLRDLQAEADAREVRVEFEAIAPTLSVWADPDPLRQVADVLARNALEATPAGGLIRFAAGGDGRKLRWSVHDNGRGMSQAEAAHLFDPFYCGRQAGRGLGMGLPRVARIVERAGGELTWQSSPEAGSTFHVVIPVSEIPVATAGPMFDI